MVTRKAEKATAEESTPESTGHDLALIQGVSNEVAKSFNSFSDVAEYFGADNIDDAAQELGDGYALENNKDKLIGVTMVLVDWNFLPGDFKVPDNVDPWPGQGMYSTIRLITQDGRKFRISDGSTGIHRQLWEYSQERERQTGLLVRRGLKKSTYSNEHSSEAYTYYLDVSA